jgi:hypothetical protein
MSDVNTFFVSGIVGKITPKNSGYEIEIHSDRESKTKAETNVLPIFFFGSAAVKENDYVVVGGYLKSRAVQRKDGSGSFLSVSMVGLNIKNVATKKPAQQELDFGDNGALPF